MAQLLGKRVLATTLGKSCFLSPPFQSSAHLLIQFAIVYKKLYHLQYSSKVLITLYENKMNMKIFQKLIQVTYKYVCVKVRLFMEYWTIFQRSLLSTYNKMRLTKQKTLCLSWGRKEKGACTLLRNLYFYELLKKKNTSQICNL